jgi:DNA-binding transcriptional LysR family regulator
MFVVLPHAHALCNKEEITWEALRDERFILRRSDPGPAIHDHVIKRIADLGYHPRVLRLDIGRETAIHLVALGLGVSLTSEATTANTFPGVEFRPIASDDVISFSAVWLCNNDNPVFRRFLSLTRALAARWNGRPDNSHDVVSVPAIGARRN